MAATGSIIDGEVLRRAAEALHGDLGDLTDLPFELANTLANVYYRFFALSEHAARFGPGGVFLRDGSTNLLAPYLEDSRSAIDAFANYTELHAEAVSSFEHARGLIQSAREVRTKEPELFSYLTTLTLDILKYNTKDPGSKTPIRRAIERTFKTPREISDLLDRMLAGGYDLYRSGNRS